MKEKSTFSLFRVIIGIVVGVLYTWGLMFVAWFYFPIGHGTKIPASFFFTPMLLFPYIWVIPFMLFPLKSHWAGAAIIIAFIISYFIIVFSEGAFASLFNLKDGWLFGVAFFIHCAVLAFMFFSACLTQLKIYRRDN